MAKKPTAPAVIDVPATDEDLVQLTNDGNAVKAFFSGLVAWFGVQREWETKAAQRLMAAKAIPAPIDKASDEVVQQFVTRTTAMEKEYEQHSTVKGLLWKLHKRAMVIHNRAADPLSEAKALGVKLHNAYVQAEQRRVAAENDRLRRDAEQKAADERKRELQRLEDDRLKAEATSENLSAREQAFVTYYLVSGHALTAAERAGFADAFKSSARLLASDKIRKAIEGKRQAAALVEQQRAIAEQPLEVGEVEEVTANVGRAATDRTTWSGEILDPTATLEAYRSGKYGIPGDLFEINQTKLNEYARSLHERLDLWPGVRHVKKTGVV